MPGVSDQLYTSSGFGGPGAVSTGEATGGRTARDATDTPGTSNPDVESIITAVADQNTQTWGHRRFVSRPLAATTFVAADGNWTWSYARSESNAAHNMIPTLVVYAWRPSTGAAVGTISGELLITGLEPGTSMGAEVRTAAWPATSLTILDGDILVFELGSRFTQSMSSAYTDSYAYDGTTEGSITTCAAFVSPPIPLTLFTPPTKAIPPVDFRRKRLHLLRR